MTNSDEKYDYEPLPQPVRISEQQWPAGTLPLVSISCVAYNHEAFIAECIEGFLMQETTFPVEILIHDDASTDETAAIIQRFVAQRPDLFKPVYQVENQRSRGVAVSQVFNLARALGKYIALCDGDDFWTDPRKLEKQASVLEADNNIVLCYGRVRVVDETGAPLNHNTRGALKDLSAIELKKGPPINTLTVMCRNVELLKNLEFRYMPLGDISIWVRLGFHGSGRYLPEVGECAYRMHRGGVFSMKKVPEKRSMSEITRFALYRFFLQQDEPEVLSYYRRSLLRSFEKSTSVRDAARFLYNVFRARARDFLKR